MRNLNVMSFRLNLEITQLTPNLKPDSQNSIPRGIYNNTNKKTCLQKAQKTEIHFSKE